MEKRMKHRLSCSEGLTFVEVIICILIISIIAVAFLALTNVSVKGIFTAGSRSKALAAVTEKADRVYSLIIGAEDAVKAEEALRSEDGWVAGEEHLDPENTGAQFYYTRTAYMGDGRQSTGVDIVVAAYYDSGKHKVEIAIFVLKTAEGD